MKHLSGGERKTNKVNWKIRKIWDFSGGPVAKTPHFHCRKHGNGNPLQYSGLENPMNRGAWQVTVHGVARVRHNWSNEARMHTISLTGISLSAAVLLPSCPSMQRQFTPIIIPQLMAQLLQELAKLWIQTLSAMLWDFHKTQTDLYIHVLSRASCGTFFLLRLSKNAFKSTWMKGQESIIHSFYQKSTATKNIPHETPWMKHF